MDCQAGPPPIPNISPPNTTPKQKQVALELGYSPANKSEGQLQLVSFHSISKGFLGECGLRGGMCG